MATIFKKTTLVPIQYSDSELSQYLPAQLSANVSIRNVSGVLTERHLEIWQEYVSLNERKEFASMKIALVNPFTSTEHLGGPEQVSYDLLYKHFIFLRIVRPTRSRFSAVQFREEPDGQIDVFRLSHQNPVPINVPDSQTNNFLTFADVRLATVLIRAFLDLAEYGPEHVRRAVRYYEAGYADIRDPILQLITWVMGIESACAAESEFLSQAELTARIFKYVPPATDIFAESPLREFVQFPPLPVQAALNDLFLLRDRFVHGLWIPEEWKQKVSYKGISTEPVVHADMLRDAASFILRKLLLTTLGERAH